MGTSAILLMLFIFGAVTVAFWFGYFFSSLFGGMEREDEILKEELIERLTKRAVNAEEELEKTKAQTNMQGFKNILQH